MGLTMIFNTFIQPKPQPLIYNFLLPEPFNDLIEYRNQNRNRSK